MKKELFFKGLAEVFESEGVSIHEETNLKDLKGFDSMGVLSLIAYIDKYFNIQCSAQQLMKINTVRDLMNFIGYDRYE